MSLWLNSVCPATAGPFEGSLAPQSSFLDVYERTLAVIQNGSADATSDETVSALTKLISAEDELSEVLSPSPSTLYDAWILIAAKRGSDPNVARAYERVRDAEAVKRVKAEKRRVELFAVADTYTNPLYVAKDAPVAEEEEEEDDDHDDVCTDCEKAVRDGEDEDELLLCESCPRCFHLECLQDEDKPKDANAPFICPICKVTSAEDGNLLERLALARDDEYERVTAELSGKFTSKPLHQAEHEVLTAYRRKQEEADAEAKLAAEWLEKLMAQ